MSANTGPLTAIERARLAYEQMKRRQYVAAELRRARDRVRNITLAVTLGTTVALFVGVTVYTGSMPESLRSSAHERNADRARTSEPRTAQIKSYVRGNTCQELRFNNDNGELIGGNLVPCAAEPKREPLANEALAAPPPKGVRLNSVRDAFAR